MTSCNFDPKLTPLPLCHANMGNLPTQCHKITYPPPLTSVTSFMNGPLANQTFLLKFCFILQVM